ncbi:hypothetical protein NM688_g2421 [Phlebia brevispora]|uniref:Uncharacterized protein n=1 Tax=Phlebia brevispora TaxID=194682 RepID=A0ACC1T8W0_9APHY|nr:hypothetical protein NM688_g2421 [Phlebia brevispora]
MATMNASLRRSARLLASKASSKEANSTAVATTKTGATRRLATSSSTTVTHARPAKRARTGLRKSSSTDNQVEESLEHPPLPTGKSTETSMKKASKAKGKAKAEPVDYTPEDFPTRISSMWRVGPHVSAAGGVENTVWNAASLGATAFALFVKSQRKWTSPELSSESIAAFRRRLQVFGYDPRDILPHGSYLVNLGNPDDEKREKSYQCFLDDLKRCEQLGLLLYNFHPGSTVGQAEPDMSLSLIAQCLNRAHKETNTIVTVIENMAGSGNVLGSKFQELGKIINEVEDKSRVGVCLDTCHMFAAGYDIRTKESWDHTMKEFEREVGLQYLRGMHLNDSMADLGSHRDRHDNIGMGFLGLKAFSHILSDPRTQAIPLIMETPAYADESKKNSRPGEGWDVWKKEVEILQRLFNQDEDREEKLQAWEAEIRTVISSKNSGLGKTEKIKTRAKKGKGTKRKRNLGEEEDEGASSCEDGD